MTPEVQRARDHFRVFLLAAKRCNEFRELPSGYLQFLSVPSIAIYAFATEVGFKALALHTLGSASKGHDLAALFRALPAQLQAQIRTETSVPSPRWDASFDQDLAMVANAFEVWRYIYEKHPVDTDLGFLQQLAGAIDVALDTIT